MNIDSPLGFITPPIEPKQSSSPSGPNLSPFYAERLHALKLLSKGLLKDRLPHFFQVIESLDFSSTHYTETKNLFLRAYIQDFNTQEKDFFLRLFMNHFDPKMRWCGLKAFSTEEIKRIWEGTISYLCKAYLGFECPTSPLLDVYRPLKDKGLTKPNTTEQEFENCFDQGLDFLLDLNAKNPSLIESKILFASYLARLINQLASYNACPCKLSLEDLKLSIKPLFSEIYLYLLKSTPERDLFLDAGHLNQGTEKSISSREFTQSLIHYLNHSLGMKLTQADIKNLQGALSDEHGLDDKI